MALKLASTCSETVFQPTMFYKVVGDRVDSVEMEGVICTHVTQTQWRNGIEEQQQKHFSVEKKKSMPKIGELHKTGPLRLGPYSGIDPLKYAQNQHNSNDKIRQKIKQRFHCVKRTQFEEFLSYSR